MSAVRGTFADFKTVKTRGQCQAIIEFPIEDADHVLAVLGGIPQPSKEQWVGVAPISDVAESKDDAPDEPVKGGPLARQAGILCGQEPFQSWLFQRELRNDWPGWGDPATAEGHAAGCIRWLCGIDTRAELDHNLTAAQTWKELTDAYYDSQHGKDVEAMKQMLDEGPG